MQKLKKITTLEELRTAKRELQLKHKVTKREIIHNFGTTTTNAKDFLLKRVALPVGGVAAAAYGIGKLTGNGNEPDTAYVNGQQVQLKRADDKDTALLFPLLLGIGRMVFNRYKQNRMVDRISHRTAAAVLQGDVPPPPSGGDDASHTNTGRPTPSEKRAPSAVQSPAPTPHRATIVDGVIHPVS